MHEVYAQTDAQGRITAINSDAFLTTTEGWTQIDQGDGDRYHHAQGNYLPGPLMTEQGILRWKMAGGRVVERTEAEIQADVDTIPPPPPSPTEVMCRALAQADVLTPAQALMHQALFDRWADRIGTTAVTGEYLRHEDGLYRVQQGHPIQAHQPPSVHTAALYTRVQPEGTVEAWQSGQSYAKDVEVAHKGGVWEPGAAGVYDNVWKRVRDS